jgi:hypothetical protein
MPDIAKHIRASRRIATDDLDWDLAARVGLSPGEVATLTYFADIEGQTVYYLREVLNTRPARDPDSLAFLTLWNYEEFFHGHAIARLLEVCGHDLGADRISEVRIGATFAARVEEVVQTLISKLFPRTFVALWMAWGASQELLTLRGYERIAAATANPVLRELCLRIARQERRHFAYYYNGARERLAGRRFSQRVVRFLFDHFWTPVGGGVKSEQQVAALIAGLFPGALLGEVLDGLDQRLARLPGMDAFDAGRRYAARIAPRLAADQISTRAASRAWARRQAGGPRARARARSNASGARSAAA